MGSLRVGGDSAEVYRGRMAAADGTRVRSIGWAAVDAKDLRDLVRFDEDGPHHEELFDSEHLWSEVVCLERNQALGTIEDPDSDALVLVVTGPRINAWAERRRAEGTATADHHAPGSCSTQPWPPERSRS